MKFILICLFVILSSCVFLTSCIQQEALNAEADIDSISVSGNIWKRNPVILNSRITCYVKPETDLTALAPTFVLTPGAVINPPSGTVRDFSFPQSYVVTSQDKRWTKTYLVTFTKSDMVKYFHFENASMSSGGTSYPELYEVGDEGDTTYWASGNPGFSILAQGKPASDYPTSISDEGYYGHCARLVTRSTGALGAMWGSPTAAGNLFLGSFSLDISSTLRSTHFGIPLSGFVPQYLSGYYKYESGDRYMLYTDSTGKSTGGIFQPGRRDSCDIYAVIYEPTATQPYLDGNSILSSPNIVSIARITNQQESDHWQHFQIPFRLLPGKVIDMNKFQSNQYNISVVFSSSKDGAHFNGSVGSTLLIDEVELTSNKE